MREARTTGDEKSESAPYRNKKLTETRHKPRGRNPRARPMSWMTASNNATWDPDTERM